ncbi:aldo/keto reductase [Fusobacterium sp. PH5-44]|uniref:aldo/keto reductase n=1 Tax=unclassified Fusobacterium TaxID=2648384 RepID=UPI003D245519
MNDKYYTLYNNINIPSIGFGTWKIPDGILAYNAVRSAIDIGYTHIDTAHIYQNEESIGMAIKDSGVPRESIFITTKLWNTEHSFDQALKGFYKSLQKLKLDYIDLYLIHWPNPKELRDKFESTIINTWNALEKLYKSQVIRAIGVSNFLPHHLSVLKDNTEILPMVNQIRLFPGSQNFKTIEYCKKENILLEGYSPFGGGEIFISPELSELSHKYNKTIGQICIRWSLQMGFLPLPKTINPERMKENIDVFDFFLSKEDIKKLKGIKNYCGPNPNPDKIHF